MGVTGNGLNDSMVLRKADVGICTSNATDAGRTNADIVLQAPGLSVIVEAVKVGIKTILIFRTEVVLTAPDVPH